MTPEQIRAKKQSILDHFDALTKKLTELQSVCPHQNKDVGEITYDTGLPKMGWKCLDCGQKL